MKLTKGMKKALSLLLSAAMVVTGVNVTTNTASAADSASFTFKLTDSSWNETAKTISVTGDGEYTYEVENPAATYVNLGWVATDADSSLKITLKNVIVNGTTFEIDQALDITSKDKNAFYNIWDGLEEDAVVFTSGKNAIAHTGIVFEEVDGEIKQTQWGQLEYQENGEKVAITSLSYVFDVSIKEAPATEVPTGSAVTTPPAVTETPEVTEAPTTNNGTAYIVFADSNWAISRWNATDGNGKGNAEITGNGDYTVSIKKSDYGVEAETVDGVTVFCIDFVNMMSVQDYDASNISISDIVIKCDDKEMVVDDSTMYFGPIEGDKNDNLRLEIRNEWGYGDGEFATKDEFDALNPEFSFADTLSVSFKVSGIKDGTTSPDSFKDAEGKFAVKTAKQWAEDAKGGADASASPSAPSTTASAQPGASTQPGASVQPGASAQPSATAAASAKPATTSTAGAVKTATPAGITTKAGITGTSKLTAAKKFVVVAPGKSVKVGYTVKKAPTAVSGAAVVKATSKSKSVATVKLNASKKKVTIKVPKKAVKGASTTVTLKSEKVDGTAVSAKIKVYVRNSAKKVKAAKKAITVKKGKTTKLVIKASKLQNKKKAFADTITVKGKIVKLTNVKYAKGKATLTLKGNKKAKNKAVTIKVGSKKVKVKATVK